ncbi:MAG: Bug family tripartite tricarboxylate transporter substrate binding protein [Burkholderiales bacterium]
MDAVDPVVLPRPLAGARRRTLGALGAAAACALVPGAARAQGFPSKPIRLVCPLPPGSPSDVLARALAERVSAAWGQPVVVDNRPGATGAIGLDAVAKAAPDGHTVGILFMTHTVLPTLFGKLPYDTERDIVPVSNLVWLYNVLVVPEASPIRSVQDLMRVAREQPGKLNYASGGNGSPAHMVAEFFKQRADLRIVHVPFKGPADAVQGLMGAQVDLMFATTSAAVPQVRAGRLRPLVVTSPQRLAALPDVPTMAEAGVTGWDVREWQGVAAPAGTPPELVGRWNAELAKSMADPGVRERLAALGMNVAAPNTAQEFAGLVKAELGRWSAMVKTLELKVD